MRPELKKSPIACCQLFEVEWHWSPVVQFPISARIPIAMPQRMTVQSWLDMDNPYVTIKQATLL
jgi:hypothetical protein